jgi:Rrf2 family protein
MITNKTKYALKALYRLAVNGSEAPMLIADIAAAEQIPHKFLELILVELKAHGLLTSRKGRGGGYLLAKPASEISIADVLRISDGPMAPVPCLSKTSKDICGECGDEATCPVRLGFKAAYSAYVESLERTTVEDMVTAAERAIAAPGKVKRYSL